jgi:hypothetical protein
LVDVGTEKVGGPHNLDMASARSGTADAREGELYMRRMVMEFEVVVDDGVVDVIGLDQVLECSRSFLWCFLDVD